METKIVTITPKIAAELLAHNDNNRPLKDNHVISLAIQIEKDKWQLNGESIIISKKGKVLDGQHRLHAVIMADKSIRSNVVYGADEESFLTIDTGRIRSGSDVLSIEGVENSAVMSSIIRAVIMWKRGSIKNAVSKKSSGKSKKTRSITNAEMVEFYNKNKNKLTEISEFIRELGKFHVLSKSSVGML